MSTRPVVAAFDVDGTLTVRDCVRPFLERLGGKRGLLVAAARQPVGTTGSVLRRDRDQLKEVMVGGVYRGRSVDEVDAHGREFAAMVAEQWLRPDTVARLRWHQAMGHRTVMVSASLRSYLDPLAATLGIERALCTDVAVADSRYLGALAGDNCRGPEKVVRLRTWLAAEGLDDAELWAYGDSKGDTELLGAASHAIWVKGTTVQAVPSPESSAPDPGASR